MKIRLGIVSKDSDYINYISSRLSGAYPEDFEVYVYSSVDEITIKFDVVILESDSYSEDLKLDSKMVLILSDNEDMAELYGYKAIYKYQRISKIVSLILLEFSKADHVGVQHKEGKAAVTAVWSPSGGVGKTSIAVARAIYSSRNNNRVLYLNLENFASTEVYFKEKSHTLSDALLNGIKNMQAFIKSLGTDVATGIKYFSPSDNYDDVAVLDKDDIRMVIEAAMVEMDEIVIDLPAKIDEPIIEVFDLASSILIVDDGSFTSYLKLSQFVNQNDIYINFRNKFTLINNKGAKNQSKDFGNHFNIPILYEDNEYLRANSMVSYLK